MQDPVMIATGHTYDRHSITRWLAQGHRTCPSTGLRLRHLELVPNFALRSAITVSPFLKCLPSARVERTDCAPHAGVGGAKRCRAADLGAYRRAGAACSDWAHLHSSWRRAD